MVPKFLQYEIFTLSKQIGFLRITYPQLFTVFIHSTKYISMYFIILRTEGQVLCLAKHYSTENRELALPELRPAFQAYAPLEIQEFPQKFHGRPHLHRYALIILYKCIKLHDGRGQQRCTATV